MFSNENASKPVQNITTLKHNNLVVALSSGWKCQILYNIHLDNCDVIFDTHKLMTRISTKFYALITLTWIVKRGCANKLGLLLEFLRTITQQLQRGPAF